MLARAPLLVPHCLEVPAEYLHCVGDVRPCHDRCVHETPDKTSVLGVVGHVLGGRSLSRVDHIPLQLAHRWCRDWLAVLHAEALQDAVDVRGLLELNGARPPGQDPSS
eukprot:54027-Eustigmatos_ZCMA.PRE.1